MKRRGFLGLLALLLPVSASANPIGIDVERYRTIYRDGRFTVFDLATGKKYQIQAENEEERIEYDAIAEEARDATIERLRVEARLTLASLNRPLRHIHVA